MSSFGLTQVSFGNRCAYSLDDFISPTVDPAVATKWVATSTEAIKTNNKDDQAWYRRGISYMCLIEMGKAEKDLTKAIILNPKNPEYLFMSAQCQYRLGKIQNGIFDLSRAIFFDSTKPQYWWLRGVYKKTLYQGPTFALPDLTKAVELEDCRVTRMSRGECYFDLKKYDLALADFTKAIEFDEENPLPWIKRAKTYRRMNRPYKALSDYAEALVLHPRDVGTWLEQANILFQLEKFEEALESFTRATELHPFTAEGWRGHRQCLYNLGREEEAENPWIISAFEDLLNSDSEEDGDS